MHVQKRPATSARDRADRRRERARRGLGTVAAQPCAAADALRSATGIADEEAIGALVELGFTAATARLLHLVPLVHVAWVEGGMSGRERRLIEDIAATRGVRIGTPAFAALAEWLERPLPEGHFERSLDVIRASLDAMPPRMRAASARALVVQSALVAAASREPSAGRDRVGLYEQSVLERISATLEG